jgi:hypothetical protein
MSDPEGDDLGITEDQRHLAVTGRRDWHRICRVPIRGWTTATAGGAGDHPRR